MDWSKNRLTVVGEIVWIGIRIVDLSDLPPEQSQAIGESLLEPAKPAPEPKMPEPLKRKVSNRDLNEFLSHWFKQFPPGDGRLTEARTFDEVCDEFGQGSVSRERVREWIAFKAPSEKRFGRGQRPRNRDVHR